MKCRCAICLIWILLFQIAAANGDAEDGKKCIYEKVY